MTRTKYSHKAIAVFFICIFLPTLFPVNFVFASNNGPMAPEAASFEPVDATDMVNLATGDLSYVLPLLNVPSPEGGYPVSLAYHGGISLDQEASWVGLGWNINPGAINRSVNGYPDDWNGGRFKEYFYDKGYSNSHTFASIGYSSFTTGVSAGLAVSYSDNKGFGGSVNLGIGISEGTRVGASMGTNGVSINGSVGLGEKSPFSIGGSIGSNGIGLSVSHQAVENNPNNNSLNFGLDSSWSGDISANASYSNGHKNKKNSIGLTLSSNGLSIRGKVGGFGTGTDLSFRHAVSQSDYNLNTNGWKIPLYVPLGEGTLNLSFGRQTIKYDLNKLVDNVVAGTLYYKDIDESIGFWRCRYYIGSGDILDPYSYQTHDNVDKNHVHSSQNKVYFVKEANSLGDVYEVDFDNYSESLELDKNNAVFPNYDNYRVTAQGLSGSMTPRIYENAPLLGLSKDIKDANGADDFNLVYEVSNEDSMNFNEIPEFQFDNEYSSSLLIQPASFDTSVSPSDIYGYLNGLSFGQETRKKGGRYVEYYTNTELSNTSAFNNGLLKANADINYSDAAQFEPDGIGAFKVTSPDGKTYHYSLPVYNHEVVSRQFGMGINSTLEDDAFFEKRQLKKYATHWLLTAVTGPDYIDVNGNSLADNGDYGYWTSMDYGKWSDGYIWYAPHGEEYIVDDTNPNLKAYNWGRKEIYYLDKIQTRTHTALFVKEERNDSQGKRQFYHHRKNASEKTILDFKAQSLLRLKEIILLKNEDANVISKNNVADLSSIPTPEFSETMTFYDPEIDGGGTKLISYSQQDNVLDKKDVINWYNVREKALKVIDFDGYSYELASGAPYTFGGVNGRLTLKYVNIKGKGGEQLLPSYKFNYNQGAYSNNHKDEWGYNKFTPEIWSLNEITMPTGGKIKIEYEPDTFNSAINHELSINANSPPDNQNNIIIDHPDNVSFGDYGIQVNSQLPVTYLNLIDCYSNNQAPEESQNPTYDYESYNGLATVVQVLNGGLRLKLKFNEEPTLHQDVYTYGQSCEDLNVLYPHTNKVDISLEEFDTGVRVSSLTVTDGIVEYRTDYDYNIPNTLKTSGIVSYVPHINNLTNDVAYGMELPPPVPMYGHVKTTTYGDNGVSQGYTRYSFKTLVPKNVNQNVGFPGILEVSKTDNSTFTDSSNDKLVNIQGIVIKDNMASLGQPLSITNYNSYGHLLTKTINNYKNPEEIDQGVSQESFQTYKEVDYKSANKTDKWLINSSTRTTYPSALASTTVIQGGITSTTYFDEYDNTSGQLLETRTQGSDGTMFKTEVVPAYVNYPSMGSKAVDLNNKNMLVQESMVKTYIDQVGEWNPISANIITWKPNSEDVWRKHKSYSWDGQTNDDGLFTSFTGQDDGFDWQINASSQPNDWKLISEIAKYDQYSMALEVKDINQNMASTKMGDNDSKTIAVGSAGYDEIHYSGAEYLNNSSFDGDIDGVGQTTERAHTGSHSIKITSEQGFKTIVPNTIRPGKYKISVWASEDTYNNARVFDGLGLKEFNGEKIPAGDWVLMNHYVDWTSGSKTVYVSSNSGTVYFDDFRIHPIRSSMNTYVYNEWEELEAILGANNMATVYEYDASGRLIRTKSEVADDDGLTGGIKMIAENVYNYSKAVSSTIEPLFAYVTYGTSSSTYQEYIGTAAGGSGDYSFKWYKGIGDSSTQFESTTSGVSPNFTWTNLSGCDTKYIKLVVTDNVYGNLGTVRVIRNHNACDSNGGGNGNPEN